MQTRITKKQAIRDTAQRFTVETHECKWVGGYAVTRFEDGAFAIETGNVEDPPLAILWPDGRIDSPALGREPNDKTKDRMRAIVAQF